MSLVLPAASTAMAFSAPVCAMLTVPEYVLLDAVGSEPSIVYLIVPSLELRPTFWAELYVPPAMLAFGAFGAVVSLLSRLPTVAPLPNVARAGVMLIGPSARPASEAAGTLEDQAAPPTAGAVTILPVESVSVMPVRPAPGWDTPLTVRSLPTFAAVIVE